MTAARFTIDKAALEALASSAELRKALDRDAAPDAATAARDGLYAGPWSPWPWSPEFATCATHGRYQVSHRVEGVVRWNPSCSACAADARIERALGSSGIPPRFQALTLGTYSTRHPGEGHALKAADHFIRSHRERGRGHCLIFTGRFGTGKTHLACAIGLGFIKLGRTVHYATAFDVVRTWRASWAPDATRSEADVLRAFVDVDLLILEEIGRQKNSEAERGHLFEIIDGRYGHNKPTLVTSNYAAQGGLKSIEGFLGQAAYDRLWRNGCEVVRFDWESYTRRQA